MISNVLSKYSIYTNQTGIYLRLNALSCSVKIGGSAWDVTCIAPTRAMKSSRQQHLVLSLCVLLGTVLVVSITQTRSSPSLRHIPTFMIGIATRTLVNRFLRLGELHNPDKSCILLISILLLSGDVESNPGPASQENVYPCGLCQMPVRLEKHTSVQWLCCKCDSITSLVLHSEVLNSAYQTPSIYYPRSIDSTIDSIKSSSVFSPLHASSPAERQSAPRNRRPSSSSAAHTNTSSLFCVSEKRNLRTMNINCQSIIQKSSELHAALSYIKPDIVCGAESYG